MSYETWLVAHGMDRSKTERAILEELIDQVDIFARNHGDDITAEIWESLPNGECRVRVFEPTPGPEPEDSIAEYRLGLDGETPTEEPLVRVVDESTEDVMFISLNACAMKALLFNYGVS